MNEKLDCDDPSMFPVQLPVNGPLKMETKQHVKHLDVQTCPGDLHFVQYTSVLFSEYAQLCTVVTPIVQCEIKALVQTQMFQDEYILIFGI